MSLIITSNTPNNDIQETTAGINKSFSYTNHLQGTLRIPKESQIGVQSVKINKDGNAMLNKYNSKFGFYFGRPKSSWILDAFTGRTWDVGNNSFMIPAFILPEGDRERNISLSTDDLADQIQKSFRKVLNCPNLCENASSAVNPGVLCTPLRNASQQGFTGFDWKIKQTALGFSNAISTKWTNFNETGTDTAATVIGTTIENANASEEVCVVGTEYPLNLSNGLFNCSLGTHRNGSDYEEFSIGLSRCNGPGTADIGGVIVERPQQPPYWTTTGAPLDGIFFDWRVCSVLASNGSHEVRIYHSVFDTSINQFTEVEFEYWNNKAGPRNGFAGNGLYWETEAFTHVHFNVSNERVKIRLNASGSGKTIVDGNGGGVLSDQNMKPSGPTTRWLFPKLIMSPGKNMIITSFSGVQVKDYVYGKCQDLDWYNQRICDGSFFEAALLDRSLNCNYTPTGLEVSDLFYNQQGLSGFGAMLCEARIVSSPTVDYYAAENVGLNSQYIFGFRNNTDVAPITGDLGNVAVMNWQSSSVPVLVSKESLFVRLKNFPIISANFSKSAMSNILYHIPTFSNSGNETGSLHFEPSEMVYLDINNTEDLFVSTMEVDLIYGDETLATGLSGKTTVVFHLRDKR